MSPSVVTGRLPADPEPGSPEWEQTRRAYEEAVARAAQLRRLEARLPPEIREAEHQVRVLGLRLGLPSATLPGTTGAGRSVRLAPPPPGAGAKAEPGRRPPPPPRPSRRLRGDPNGVPPEGTLLRAVLEALPARLCELRRRIPHYSPRSVDQSLQDLRRRGLVCKDPGYGAVWRRAEPSRNGGGP